MHDVRHWFFPFEMLLGVVMFRFSVTASASSVTSGTTVASAAASITSFASTTSVTTTSAASAAAAEAVGALLFIVVLLFLFVYHCILLTEVKIEIDSFLILDNKAALTRLDLAFFVSHFFIIRVFFLIIGKA
jgi:hypothetical protein